MKTMEEHTFRPYDRELNQLRQTVLEMGRAVERQVERVDDIAVAYLVSLGKFGRAGQPGRCQLVAFRDAIDLGRKSLRHCRP